jgi:hypothetical protein
LFDLAALPWDGARVQFTLDQFQYGGRAEPPNLLVNFTPFQLNGLDWK